MKKSANAKTNAELCRDWYRRNRARKCEMALRLRQDIRRLLEGRKRASGCLRCNERDPACLVFHHRDAATKSFDLGLAANRSFSLKRIEAEVAKCDVLCANCHLKLHWDERQAAKSKRTG